MTNHDKDLLEEYTRWLLKNQYTDSDVYDEPPTAVDRFIRYKEGQPNLVLVSSENNSPKIIDAK
jgi:hypothetical protein